jgi:hypothetical protein
VDDCEAFVSDCAGALGGGGRTAVVVARHFGGVECVFGAVEALLLGRVGWGWMEV